MEGYSCMCVCESPCEMCRIADADQSPGLDAFTSFYVILYAILYAILYVRFTQGLDASTQGLDASTLPCALERLHRPCSVSVQL